jgi:hypothetical protein
VANAKWHTHNFSCNHEVLLVENYFNRGPQRDVIEQQRKPLNIWIPPLNWKLPLKSSITLPLPSQLSTQPTKLTCVCGPTQPRECWFITDTVKLSESIVLPLTQINSRILQHREDWSRKCREMKNGLNTYQPIKIDGRPLNYTCTSTSETQSQNQWAIPDLSFLQCARRIIVHLQENQRGTQSGKGLPISFLEWREAPETSSVVEHLILHLA